VCNALEAQKGRNTMEQVPNWLEAAVLAAGMATVYVADDWMVLDSPNALDTHAPLLPPTAH
jgi:hypothetical protein